MTSPAPDTDFATLMEETPVGANSGRFRRILSTDSADTGSPITTRTLDPSELQSEAFQMAGGWQIERGTAHRGVLHADEYVDPDALREMVAAEMGFTVEEIEGAYKNGRPTPQRASMRAHIDGRLLALSRSGGNMIELARALGWDVQEECGNSGPTCRMLFRALERAKAAEAAA